MNFLFNIIFAVLFTCILSACQQQESTQPKIGIIVPLEHKALQEIVTGFTEKLHEIYPHPVQIKVMNAQGDANLQRAIIQQMRDQHYTLIVPIASGVTEMTLSMIHQQPIVSLASELTEQDRQKLHPCNITLVHDEVPPQTLIAFLHAAYPQLKHLVLIHSTADKIFPDVKHTIEAGKQNQIDIKPIMVTSLPELVNAAAAIPAETQGIFILKDNLIVSGITILAKIANDKHIPLYTSDNGSVESGAGFALGVHEREIGEEGAKLAAQVLNGKSACELPIFEMKQLTVFMNTNALKLEQQEYAPIENAAKQLGYQLERIEGK